MGSGVYHLYWIWRGVHNTYRYYYRRQGRVILVLVFVFGAWSGSGSGGVSVHKVVGWVMGIVLSGSGMAFSIGRAMENEFGVGEGGVGWKRPARY